MNLRTSLSQCHLPACLQRLERTGILINAFRAVIAATPADLLPMVYLCTNRVAPAHAGVELGIGDATLIKARWALIVSALLGCWWKGS